MRDLLATTDPVLLSFVQSLLTSEGIGNVVFDENISLTEGSIGIFPKRLAVPDADWCAAAQLLTDAGLDAWIKDDGRH